MKTSKLFWIGAILLAIIPMVALDIPKLYVDWKNDVRDERVFIHKNFSSFSTQQRDDILEEIERTDQHFKLHLIFLIGTSLIFFAIAGYFLWRYFKIERGSILKSVFICLLLMAVTSGLKIYSWTTFSGNNEIRLLELSPADTSLEAIYNNHFKGKVVYVDFWGTTCPPCLEEFRNFTRPLKQHYEGNTDIAYFYIASGTRLIWKQQLQKFDLSGNHIFLDQKAYAALYHNAVRGAKDTILEMPRYLIMNKAGNIVDKDAPGPSQADSLETRLDKYLNLHN